jgi:hypothetical protein
MSTVGLQWKKTGKEDKGYEKKTRVMRPMIPPVDGQSLSVVSGLGILH